MQCQLFEDVVNMAFDCVYFDVEPMAISLLLRPSAISAMISRSRFVIRTVMVSSPFPSRSACSTTWVKSDPVSRGGRILIPALPHGLSEEILYCRVFEDETHRTGLHKLDDVQL